MVEQPPTLNLVRGQLAVSSEPIDLLGLKQGAVSPSVDNLLEIIQACGFDLPLELVPRDDSAVERLRKNVLLSPERRVERILKARANAAR